MALLSMHHLSPCTHLKSNVIFCYFVLVNDRAYISHIFLERVGKNTSTETVIAE